MHQNWCVEKRCGISRLLRKPLVVCKCMGLWFTSGVIFHPADHPTSEISGTTSKSSVSSPLSQHTVLVAPPSLVGFSRLVGGAYAYALLSVFMRIQLSILGGRMFRHLHQVSYGRPGISCLPIVMAMFFNPVSMAISSIAMTMYCYSQGSVSTAVQKEYLSIVQHLLKEGESSPSSSPA